MEKKCVFCDRSNFEDRIVWENEDFFLIATLGQITDGGYLLLIPKEHISCMGAIKSRHIPKTDMLNNKITKALREEYNVSSVSVFEHGIVGQTVGHAHIHFIPAECDLGEKIKKDFPRKEVDGLYSWGHLKSLYRTNKKPYLVWHGKNQINSWKRVIWDPSPVPAQYLRIIFSETIGRSERSNWKHVDPDSDKKLIRETVERMKKYFK